MPNCTQTITEKPPCLTVDCNQFIQNFLIKWSLHPYMTTAWELGKWGLIREDHSLPKVQWLLDHLLGPSVSPGHVGWSEKCLASRCSTFVPKSSKVSSDWWHTQLHFLWQISSWDSSFPLYWSLKASDRYPVDGPGQPEQASIVSLALFLNWVMTQFTVDSGMDWFLDICRWLAPISSWPRILPPLKIYEFQGTW